MTNLGFRKRASLYQKTTTLAMLAATLIVPTSQRTEAATNVVIWDTGSRLADAADLQNRARWKSVPSELFVQEADPPKAASDPGYYGREYAFKGDPIVENSHFVAVFWSAKGSVVIYSKDSTNWYGGGAARDARLGTEIAACVPLQAKTTAPSISRFGILRNADDEVALQATFSAKGAADSTALFVFDRTEIVEIRAAENMDGVRLESPVEYVVAPGFIGDDLIYSSEAYTSASTICIPAEHIFVGLVSGENAEIVVTWPNERLPVKLNLGNGSQ